MQFGTVPSPIGQLYTQRVILKLHEIALLAFQMCTIFCKLGAPQAYLTQVFEALLRQSIAHHLDMIIARCTSRRQVKIVTIIGLSK